MTHDEQHRVVLTPHPLQRVGAFALAYLAGVDHPDRVTPDGFQQATKRMTDDAVKAALLRDSKQPDGYWLKCSRSFFPNSRMNHPSIGRRSNQELEAGVREWRGLPGPGTWPAASCVLCGRAAVRFFGKLDVPLAESDLYRNTTPRGHEGTALCWPCVCSFYALPYGCRLTGGPSTVLHSWDDKFLQTTVGRRVALNKQILAAGRDTIGQPAGREVVALQALRRYDGRVRAGVELMVFSNDNRGGSIESYAISQPLAEWLRRRFRHGGDQALLRAHQKSRTLGAAVLARNAFREPRRIVATCARYLAAPAHEHGVVRPATPALAELIDSFVREVLGMDEKDLAVIRGTAERVATLLAREKSGGKLREFYAALRGGKLRTWLHRRGVDWALDSTVKGSEPLVTTRGFELLFDPSYDSHAWFHRELLLVGVLEELHRQGWQPPDADDVRKALADDADDIEEELNAMNREDPQ